MSHLKHIMFLIVIFTIASIQVMADEDVATRSGLRPDAPQYAIRGSYPVGTQDMVIDGDTPLDITIWYPALNPDNLAEVIVYPYELKWNMPAEMIATVSGHAIADAAYNISDGPYPLVVLSHGFALGRTGYAWLAEHLASYGFVVVAPEHHEEVTDDLSGFWKAAITRPQEIHAVLDYIDAQVATDGIFEGLINNDVVAVIGHSYGGYTSLAMASARFDIHAFEATCETANNADDPNGWLCGLFLPYLSDLAESAGFDTMPDGLWRDLGDDRIDAIIPMAGDAYLFDQAGLAEITIPVMAMGGTLDTGTPYTWGAKPTFDYVSSDKKVIVGLENAEHLVFSATCEDLPLFAEIGMYSLCSDPVWDMNRAHDLVSHFATAFLLAELNQDSNAAAALAPESAIFPGVIYEAQGY